MKITFKTAIATLPLILLSACVPKAPDTPTLDNTEMTLSEASYSVSRSISSLSETAQAAHPLPELDAPPSPASYGMAGLAFVDWSGPAEPILKQMANACGYRLRVLGTAPGIPVLVTVYDKNTMIADIIRDIGFQCGRRATVVIFPESRVIELRYAKN